MDAASSRRPHGAGAPRLLAHFAALDRVTAAGETGSARVRLERELGSELAGRLVSALAGDDGGRRPAFLLV